MIAEATMPQDPDVGSNQWLEFYTVNQQIHMHGWISTYYLQICHKAHCGSQQTRL